jgi:antitoxin component HigA of HigAB toxin-antitoxin module
MAYTKYRICNFGSAYAGALANAGFALAGDVAWSAVTELLSPLGVATGCVQATITFPDAYAGALIWTPDRTATPVRYAIEEINPGNDENTDTKVSSRLATAGYATAPTAVQIRQEIDLNSTKLDVAVSTRMATGAVPTVVQIRQEMDSNSTKLANLNATVASRSTYAGGDTAGVTTLLTYLTPTRATKLDFLDVAVSSRLATAGYTAPNTVTPPTVVQIRQELDANSTKLANLNATISSRSTYAGGDTAGTTTLLSLLTPTRATKLDFLDVAVSSRLATAGYTAPPAYTTPPTVVQIRQELDSNSTKLALLDAAITTRSTYAGGDTTGVTTLLGRLTLGRAINLDNLDVAVSTRLATAGYTPPPAGSTPPTVVQIRQEMDANSTKLANLDAAVSSRSTYAGADTAGTTTLLLRLTSGRALLLDNLNAAITTRMAAASYVTPPTPPTVVQIRQELDSNSTKLANLDAAVSTRSTYAGGDSSGVTLLLARLTSVRATYLDNLSAGVLGGLVGGPIPTTSQIVTALYDSIAVNTTTFRTLLQGVAAVSCGNVVENADHTTTEMTDINDPGGVARVTSLNTPTTRQVSIH